MCHYKTSFITKYILKFTRRERDRQWELRTTKSTHERQREMSLCKSVKRLLANKIISLRIYSIYKN